MQKLNMIKKINDSYDQMSKGQKRIADYLLQHYDKAAFMTASKLGDTVGVSESTVVRFACALDYDGYPSLQKSLQEIIKSRLTNIQRLGLGENMQPEDIIESIYKSDINSLKKNKDIIDYSVIHDVARSMIKANMVYILGLRSSATLAQFCGYYLNFILDSIRLVTSGTSDIFGQLVHAKKNDIVIGISYPRYSSRTLEGMKFAKSNGAQLVAITDNEMSPLYEVADKCILASSDMNLFVDSLVAPLSTLNALILLVGILKKEDLKTNFSKLEQIWNEYNVYAGKDDIR